MLSAGDTRDPLSVAVNSELTESAGCRHRSAQAPRLSSEMTFYTTAPLCCQSLERHSGMWRSQWPLDVLSPYSEQPSEGNMSSPCFTCEQQAGTARQSANQVCFHSAALILRNLRLKWGCSRTTSLQEEKPLLSSCTRGSVYMLQLRTIHFI